MSAETQETWAAGIRAAHDEAAGVLSVEVIRAIDALELMADAINGDAERKSDFWPLPMLQHASKLPEERSIHRYVPHVRGRCSTIKSRSFWPCRLAMIR